jgi:hypothetical protein
MNEVIRLIFGDGHTSSVVKGSHMRTMLHGRYLWDLTVQL